MEEWTYNPISYYLIIFRKNEIVSHQEYTDVYNSVIGLLSPRDKKGGFINSELINSEIDNILNDGYSLAYNYDDNTIGVIFTSKYANHKYTHIPPSGGMIGEISKYILGLERGKKLDKLLI